MNFKTFSNNELIKQLKVKVENERKLLMEILHALREVEIRSLHLEMGYPDLYTFAMKELGYSSGSAYRRISAMRLLQAVPEAAQKLETGELGLENASQAQSFFRKEDQRRKEQGEIKLTFCEKREVLTELLGKSTREGQRVLLEKSPDVMMPTEKTRPLPEQKTLVQFIAPVELMEKLAELKHLLAHKNFEGRMDILIDQMADLALSNLKPKVLKNSQPSLQSVLKLEPNREGKMPTNSSPAPRMKRNATNSQPRAQIRSRYISVKVRRKVLLKNQNGCTFKDPNTGRVCQSKHGLQFEHIKPYSQGGDNHADNLTLLCGAHNRHQAERMGLYHSR